MGLFRKMTSISTLGLVDFRSDKERTAAYTRSAAHSNRQMAREAKRQTRMMRTGYYANQIPPNEAPAPISPPPGWYADPSGQPVQRWWDGTRWTEHVLQAPSS